MWKLTLGWNILNLLHGHPLSNPIMVEVGLISKNLWSVINFSRLNIVINSITFAPLV
jgi:hypothetical protein